MIVLRNIMKQVSLLEKLSKGNGVHLSVRGSNQNYLHIYDYYQGNLIDSTGVTLFFESHTLRFFENDGFVACTQIAGDNNVTYIESDVKGIYIISTDEWLIAKDEEDGYTNLVEKGFLHMAVGSNFIIDLTDASGEKNRFWGEYLGMRREYQHDGKFSRSTVKTSIADFRFTRNPSDGSWKVAFRTDGVWVPVTYIEFLEKDTE